jgi:hypothetical protein
MCLRIFTGKGSTGSNTKKRILKILQRKYILKSLILVQIKVNPSPHIDIIIHAHTHTHF